MNTSYQYPALISQNDQFTPELMPLWHDAINDLKKRRNQYILWQVPVFLVLILLFLASFLILGVFAIFLIGITLFMLGLLNFALTPTYDYIVSKDKLSAKFYLRYKFGFREIIDELTSKFKNKASEDVFGLFTAIMYIIAFPFLAPASCILNSVFLLNELWWLDGFKQWTERLEKATATGDNRQHIRGTNILPSVQLSGTSPASLPPEPIEIAEGTVTLLPDGGIVIQGGATFDRNSTFGNFSINGVTLTRESIELLTVSHKESELAFRFDGTSWTKA